MGQNVQKVLLELELKNNASCPFLLVFNPGVLMLHITAPESALGDGNMNRVGGHSEALSVNMSIFEKNRSCGSCSLLVLNKRVYSRTHCF